MGKHYTPEYWRQRAEEARAAAEQFRDAKHRRIMIEIADGYARIAQSAEQLEKARDVLAKIGTMRKVRSA